MPSFMTAECLGVIDMLNGEHQRLLEVTLNMMTV